MVSVGFEAIFMYISLTTLSPPLQVWSNGILLSDSQGMVCVELPQLPRIDN